VSTSVLEVGGAVIVPVLAHADLDWVFDEGGFLINRARPADHEIVDGPTEHRQVWIEHRDGTGALVDEGIAATIVALWRAAVDTSFSCQGAWNAWRYVTVRPTQRFLAAGTLAQVGERFIEQRGIVGGWFFQLTAPIT